VERVAGRTLSVDRALTWAAGATHAVQLRDPMGVPHRVVGVTAGATAFDLLLPTDAPFEVVGAGAALEPTALAFGVVDEEVRDWTVSRVTPGGDTVTIEAANYNPAVYDGAAAHTRGDVARTHPVDA
jgi:hypothetical protein